MNTCADHISEIKAEKEDQENENHILSDTALNQTPCIPNLIFRPVQLELPPFSAMTLAKKIFKVKMGQRCRSKKKQHKLSSRHEGKKTKKGKSKNRVQFSLRLSPILSTCPPHASRISNSLLENYTGQEISHGSDPQIDNIHNNPDQVKTKQINSINLINSVK